MKNAVEKSLAASASNDSNSQLADTI